MKQIHSNIFKLYNQHQFQNEISVWQRVQWGHEKLYRGRQWVVRRRLHLSLPSCALWTTASPPSYCERQTTWASGHVTPSAASCHCGSISAPSQCAYGHGCHTESRYSVWFISVYLWAWLSQSECIHFMFYQCLMGMAVTYRVKIFSPNSQCNYDHGWHVESRHSVWVLSV